MTLEITLLISIISVVFSIFFGLKNNKRTDVKDIEERVKENTKINMKLDNILDNITEMKNEKVEMRKDILNHDSRIVKVEESCKQAHHRLDNITDRLNMRGGQKQDDE